jgi:hypothetical protein
LFGTKNADEARAELHRNPVKYQDDQIEAFLRDPDGFTRETLGTQ